MRTGQIAAGLIDDATTAEVARAFATRIGLNVGSASPAVTVVTNALNVAAELAVRRCVKIMAAD